MTHDHPQDIQDYLVFGEYGGVNPSVTDSSTFTFLDPATMSELFEHEIEGCFLYSRHWNPTNKALADALALMESSEAAQVTASGMAAISCTLLQLCQQGDEIISGRTIYGGTHALLNHFLPRFGVYSTFVDILDPAAVIKAITPRTRVIFCESVSNPLLEVADIPTLSRIARQHNLTLVVDNTFSPLIISPIELGADVVVHSLTKYINGTSDTVAGAICASKAFIDQLVDVHSGATMLLGPVLDSFRAASILKNLHSLHIRMKQHSLNARYLAECLQTVGLTIHYPGLPDHPQHERMTRLMNPDFGYGGMLTINMGSKEKADELMVRMQDAKVGYLAVSLGFFKTLFSAPGSSTSSEIPAAEQEAMGLSDGLVRMSVGLDHNIECSFGRIYRCLQEMGEVTEREKRSLELPVAA
ncbi:MAG: aminotransferase class I/II-fold pyridoxal phosphate-dependent enzyme [Ardenticatenaceae bacterium]|nr:aminotransferase class I/II-fold pyridoxal phosphate-dependent enzyme [Ardenticatenaceae bacterium]